MVQKTRIIGAALAIGLMLTGCSQLKDLEKSSSSVTEKASKVASDSAKVEEEVEDSDPTKLSGPGQSKWLVMETIMERCPVDSSPFQWSDSPGNAISMCDSKIERAQNTADSFPKVDMGKPKYEQAQEYAAKLTESVPTWQKELERREAESAENAKRREAFEAQVRENQSLLRTLHNAKTEGPGRVLGQTVLLGELEDAQKLEALAEGCKNKDWRTIETYADGYESPETACDLAENWETEFESYLDKMVAKYVKNEAQDLDYRVRHLREDGATHRVYRKKMANPEKFVEESIAEYKPVYEELGAELSTEVFDALAKAAEGYPKALEQATSVNRWVEKATHKDSQMKAAVNRTFGDFDLKVVKYGLTHADWTIKKNAMGTPLYRIRDAAVMVRADGEDFCRLYEVTGKAQFDGTGYTKPSIKFDTSTHGYFVSSCP